MPTINELVTAQDTLESAIVAAIEAFKTDNPEVRLDSVYVNTFAPEGEKAVTSTVSATIDGAKIARSS